ncbi:MAG: F0F1 ATP synthase subunit A [Clostridium sp.]|nr:F0F1 ATP synthase subunit A [Clostridium sp.]
MRKAILTLLMLFVAVLISPAASGAASEKESAGDEMVANTEKEEETLDPKSIIFDHLGDRYGWEVPFNHHKSIPLPIIVYGKDGFHCFMSSRVDHGKSYTDGNATFRIAPAESPYKGKIVEIVDGKEYRPWDISITKNVCALFIAIILVIWSVLSLARWYKGGHSGAPRKVRGAIESLIAFVYDGAIKPSLGAKAPRFAPYLLTVFFFILYMNLLGLAVIFPGGANLTGNIAVTLILALFTFFFTNLFATKHYWKDIFWPDVPIWLKFPIPIMQVIEIFGIFTKPAALTVRLFANMVGGHMIVIVLTLLIFIFAALGAAATGLSVVVSVMFSLFMLLIDVLVSFIQAYVFTVLSTIFIAMAQEEGHSEKHGEAHGDAHQPAETSSLTPATETK